MTPLPRITTVSITDRRGFQYEVPGHASRGLALTQPHAIIDLEAIPIQQGLDRPAWSVTHLPSGLLVGTIWGPIDAAWARLQEMEEVADWTRPAKDVYADPACQRINQELVQASQEEVSR